MKRSRLSTLTLTLLILGSQKGSAAENSEASHVYRARYMMSGYLVRAGAVCDAEAKHMIEVGLQFIGSAELKSVAKAFPATTERWMNEGAERFNSEVMKSGIKAGCNSALATAKQFEQKQEASRQEGQQPRSKPERWVSVEATNGAVIKVDMESKKRWTGGTMILAYPNEGSSEVLLFDCNGHYATANSQMQYMPPRSVMAQISALACGS